MWVARWESVSIRSKIPSAIIYEILASVGKQNKGHSIFEGHKTWLLGIMTSQDDVGRMQFYMSLKNSPVLNMPLLLTFFSLPPLIKALIFQSYLIYRNPLQLICNQSVQCLSFPFLCSLGLHISTWLLSWS